MSKVINLKQVRKTRARNEKRTSGAENAARFGRTKAEREAEAAQETRAARHLDNHAVQKPQSSGKNAPDEP